MIGVFFRVLVGVSLVFSIASLGTTKQFVFDKFFCASTVSQEISLCIHIRDALSSLTNFVQQDDTILYQMVNNRLHELDKSVNKILLKKNIFINDYQELILVIDYMQKDLENFFMLSNVQNYILIRLVHGIKTKLEFAFSF